MCLDPGCPDSIRKTRGSSCASLWVVTSQGLKHIRLRLDFTQLESQALVVWGSVLTLFFQSMASENIGEGPHPQHSKKDVMLFAYSNQSSGLHWVNRGVLWPDMNSGKELPDTISFDKLLLDL